VENGNGGVAALNLEKYDEHVRELIHTIETKGAERESAVSECEELFEIAQQLKDDALAGYACFCHGDIYTNYQTDGETINYLTRAIQYLKKTVGDPDKVLQLSWTCVSGRRGCHQCH